MRGLGDNGVSSKELGSQGFARIFFFLLSCLFGACLAEGGGGG